MKNIRKLLILTALTSVLNTCTSTHGLVINAVLVDRDKVQISFQSGADLQTKTVELYRSTANLSEIQINAYEYPITKYTIPGDSIKVPFMDEFAAQNTTYYYRAKAEHENSPPLVSNTVSITTPEVALESVSAPNFLIDKIHYYLEVRDGRQSKKRYPVALGQNPIRRKLHVDYASTPEGFYTITNLQPKATYYKAYDINYPNSTDWIRYNLARKENLISPRQGLIPGIGGEIQIHGMGIVNNWTWGCIAMRNEDIDELFRHQQITIGTPVTIIGQEITKENIVSITAERSVSKIKEIQRILNEQGFDCDIIDGILGPRTRYAIGSYQLSAGLPITCDLDKETVERITGGAVNHLKQ